MPDWKEKESGKKEQKLSKDVKVLEKTLRKRELLEEMLRLLEEHTGIDLRKKFGIRQ